MKVFLSGSKTAVTLPPELTTLLDSYCELSASFLIGDCFGADRLMLQYLSERQYPNVTVHVSGDHMAPVFYNDMQHGGYGIVNRH